MIFNNRKGFTMVEVLTAIGIFSIGFLAVASLQTDSLSRTTETRLQTEAWELASSRAEALFQLPFYPDFESADDASRFADNLQLTAGTHQVDISYTDRSYRVEWEVTDMDAYAFVAARNLYSDDPETLFKSIVVTVFETDRSMLGVQRPDRELAQIQFVKVCDYEI